MMSALESPAGGSTRTAPGADPSPWIRPRAWLILLPVLLLSACFQSDTSITVPIASGFVPVQIILMIDGESLALSFISAKEAMVLPMSKPQDMLANMKDLMKSRIAIDPALYQRAKMDVMALMAASEIRGDRNITHVTNTLSVMLGGPGDTMLTLAIFRNAATDFPRAGQDLIILMNSLRQPAAP